VTPIEEEKIKAGQYIVLDNGRVVTMKTNVYLALKSHLTECWEMRDKVNPIMEQMRLAHAGAEAMKEDKSLPLEWRAWATSTSAELSELLSGARQRETIESWTKFLKNSQPEL
jgi:hypothetical protein